MVSILSFRIFFRILSLIFSFTMLLLPSLFIALSFIHPIIASPTPDGTKPRRAVVSGTNAINSILSSVVSGVPADASEAAAVFSAILGAVEDTVNAQVTGTPTSVPQVTSGD